MDKTNRKYTVEEIKAAVEALKAELDENFGPGTGEIERYLIDDVANDIIAFLAADVNVVVNSDDEDEREADDDETLFVGQNYGWFRENGEW